MSLKDKRRKFTDETPMPFGMYKDEALEDVPAQYLLKLYYGDFREPLSPGPLRDYIEENLEVLESEVRDKRDDHA